MTNASDQHQNPELTKAIAHFELLSQKNPDDVQIQINLAWSYERAKEFGSAVEGFRRALKINPTNTDAQYGLGLALLGSGQIEEALESFERARKLADLSEDRGYTAIVHHHITVFARRYSSQP